MNATGGTGFDVAIVGLGPAGRALASRCAAVGVRVLAVDPDPDTPWRQTLSLWAEQLPPWLPRDVLAHSFDGPALYAPDRSVLDMEYAVLDSARLREALPLGPGVTVERARVDDAVLASLLDRAHRVVDCRGARPEPGIPLQTAYGLVLDARDAAPALGGDGALFMDWRTDYRPPGSERGGDDDEVGPTFLYALPLDPDRVLLEETCLAGLPAPDPVVLARRLRSRLLSRGVAESAIDSPLAVERVRIPLLPPTREIRHQDGTRPGASASPLGSSLLAPLVEAFGTAGGHGHAATGYSVAAMLEAVPAAVHAIETGMPVPAPRSSLSTGLHRVGLRALLGADEHTLHALFGAFGRLGSRHQLWYLDGASPSYQVAGGMWRMWLGMPPRAKAGLVRAVL